MKVFNATFWWNSRNLSIAFLYLGAPRDLIKHPSFKETFDITFCLGKWAFSATNLGQNIFIGFDGLWYIDAIAVSQVSARHRFQHFHG